MKQFIQNRKGEKVCVLIEAIENQKGIAFCMHGLSGNKEEPHLRKIIQAFHDNDISVISFDTTNTFGESDGNYENATITNYYEDLEDVITWSKGLEIYEDTFFIAGHSLGGICTALYAQHHPEKIRGLAPISTVVSGELSLTKHSKEELDAWKLDGYMEKKSSTSATGVKKLKWSHMEDRLQYDLLKNAHTLTMPTLMIVGSHDESTPAEHNKMLFDALPGKKEFHIIQGADHCFKSDAYRLEVYALFYKWVKSFLEE